MKWHHFFHKDLIWILSAIAQNYIQAKINNLSICSPNNTVKMQNTEWKATKSAEGAIVKWQFILH